MTRPMELFTTLLALGSGYGLSRLAERLRDHQRTPRGFVDFVPVFSVAHPGPPSILLNKDGSFSATYRFQGPDRSSSTDEQLNSLVSQFSRAFAPYVNSWTFHIDLVRRPAPGYPSVGAFPDPVTRLLDAQRREAYLAAGALFETQTFLTCTFRPAPEVYQRVLLRLQQGVEEEQRAWTDSLSSFMQQVQALAGRLGSVVRVYPLSVTEQLSHLHSCLSGSNGTILDPGPGVFLDQVLANRSFTTGWQPRLDDLHLTPVAINHLPGTIPPAHLDALNDLPFPYRLSVRLSPLGSREAQTIISRYTQTWFWGQKSARDLLTTKDREDREDPFKNQHAVEMMHDAAAATATNQAGEHRFAYFTAVVLVPGSTRAESSERAAHLAKLLEDRGYSTRVETYNATAAYHGSIPGQSSANLRAPLLNLLPCSALAPLTALWPGLGKHPCSFYPATSPPILVGRTEGSTPFRLYLHSGDLGHTIVVGPPGAGKSTLLVSLAAGHLRYPQSRVYLFDRDLSALLFARATGARHYDIGDEGVSFQPLRHLESTADRASALTWLQALVALQLPRVSVAQSAALDKALADLAVLDPHLRTLSVFQSQISDKELRHALQPFTNGPYAGLLGADQDTLEADRLQVFEMRKLMDLDPKVHLPVLMYLLNRIDRDLDGSPTLIVLDEAGIALLHPVFANRIRDWALTLRKRNAAIVLALQALSQLGDSDSFGMLLQSCPTRIFLPNDAATSPAVAPFYAACGLNPRQIEVIARARRKSEYYFANPDGARLFGLALTPAELAFYGTLPGQSLQETHEAMRAAMAQHGSAWPVAWLHAAGLKDAARQLSEELQ
jgi:type IV secretion system protein TrbE